MYTSYIGKKFLNYYNKIENKNYSAKDFFDEIMFPLFFDHPIYLMWVHNSPFDQLNKESAKKKKIHFKKKKTESFVSLLEMPSERKRKKEELFAKVNDGVISGSTAVGYPVFENNGGTSGQITEMQFNFGANDLLSSWIGQALALGIKGGYLIIDHEVILYKIFRGWSHYRKFLNTTPKMKGNQIETWNAHWLKEVLLQEDFLTKEGISFVPPTDKITGSDTLFSIKTLKWSALVLILAKAYPNEVLTCYSYVLSKMNYTYGFLNVYLPKVKHLYEIRDKFFVDSNTTGLPDQLIISMEPFYDIKEASKKGSLGLITLEPKGLREYIPKGTYKYSKGKSFNVTEKNYTTYLIYKLWVIAMLNKTELLRLAEKLAQTLIEYKAESSESGRGKKVTEQEVKNILESRNIKYFIDNLTDLMQKQSSNKSMFKEIVEEVLKMPQDNFPLFVTLIKFEYNYQK